MKTIIGIDPGENGGIAVNFPTGVVLALSFSDNNLFPALHHINWEQDNLTIYMEKVHAMPSQGVTSMFTFGKNVGRIEGYLKCKGHVWVDVTPQTWQKALGLIEPRIKGVKLTSTEKEKIKREKKKKMLAMAQSLYPEIFKGLNKGQSLSIADAVLIAHYGVKKENEIGINKV